MVKEKVDNFLSTLEDHISAKVSDGIDRINVNTWDSCAGMASYYSLEKLEKALYDLFDVEDDEEEDK